MIPTPARTPSEEIVAVAVTCRIAVAEIELKDEIVPEALIREIPEPATRPGLEITPDPGT